MATINMQIMRYINLLDKTSHVKTSQCFMHNNSIFFAVKERDVSKAIGPAAINVKKMQEQIGKRVKIIKISEGIEDAQRFIRDIVAPVRIKSIEVKDDCAVVT